MESGLRTEQHATKREHATLLRFDVVNSTTFTDVNREQPEGLIAFIEEAGDCCHDLGGILEAFAGDSLLVSFGAHSSIERSDRQNSAYVAVDAALRILEIADRSEFSIRIAVHNGLAQVREVRSRLTPADDPPAWTFGQIVTGLAPTIVTRVEGLAPSGRVWVTSRVEEMTREWFDFEGIDPRDLKGLSEKEVVYGVLRRTPAASRLARRRQKSPLFGRERECEELKSACRQDSVVALVGDAGIGKTRLVRELERELRTLWVSCSTHKRAQPFRALFDAISALSSADDRPLSERLADLGADAATISVLGAVAEPVIEQPSLSDRTTDIIDAAHRLLIDAPTTIFEMIVIDDIQWADDFTLRLVERLLSEPGGTRTVLTCRSENVDRVAIVRSLRRVDLQPLAPEATAELVDDLLTEDLPAGFTRADLVQRSGGIPLYAQELVASAFGKPSRTVPPSLYDLLASRIKNRGSVEQSVVELASVFGRRVRRDMLAALAVIRDSEDQVRGAIARLVDDGFLKEADGFVEFSHDLLRDVALDRVPHDDRRWHHARIAEALVGVNEMADAEPSRIAHHFREAGQLLSAAEWWVSAAQTRAAQGAQLDALDHYRRSLGTLVVPEVAALATASTDDAIRIATLHVATQIGLGVTLVTTSERAYADDEARLAYEAAASIVCTDDAVQPEALIVYWGLWAYYVVRGNHRRSRDFAQRCLDVSAIAAGEEALLIGHCTMGYQYLYEGHLLEARQHLTVATEQDVKAITTPLPQDPTVAAWIGLAVTEQYANESANAIDAIGAAKAALESVAEYRRFFTQAYLGCFEAWAHQLGGDAESARVAAQGAVRVATDHGFATWAQAARIHEAIALASLTEDAKPIAVNDLVDGWQLGGHDLMTPYFRLCAAELALRNGDRASAIGYVAAAQEASMSSGEHLHDPRIALLQVELNKDAQP